MNLAELFISIAKIIPNLHDAILSQKKETIERHATYLDEISKCLDEIAKKLRSGERAVKECSELHHHMFMLNAITSINQESHKRIINTLKDAQTGPTVALEVIGMYPLLIEKDISILVSRFARKDLRAPWFWEKKYSIKHVKKVSKSIDAIEEASGVFHASARNIRAGLSTL